MNIELNTPRVEKDYWIDTKGRIIKYIGPLDDEIVSMHYEIAIQEFPGLEDNNRGQTDYLFDLGWIMIGRHHITILSFIKNLLKSRWICYSI